MKKRIAFALTLLFILGWSALIYFIGPKVLVETIGVERGYLLVFIVASIGAVSTLTSTSFYATVATLAAGGLNPLLLGLLGGLGVSIGDSLFYYLGYRGRKVMPHKWMHHTRKVTDWLDEKPEWFTPAFAFIYTGFTPFPNDILMVGLAITRVKYKKIIPAVIAGNILGLIFFSYMASFGWNLF